MGRGGFLSVIMRDIGWVVLSNLETSVSVKTAIP